jgi:hypothetical protein
MMAKYRGGITMHLQRSMAIAGIATAGFCLTVLLASIEPAISAECPCKKIASGACIPDPACDTGKKTNKGFAPPPNRRPAFQGRGGGFSGYGSGATTRSHSYSAPRPGSAPTVTAPARSSPPPSADIELAPARGRAAPTSAPIGGAPVGGGGRLRILETGYSQLSEFGKEEDGYGLYSYAILPSDSTRAALFLGEVFKQIPSIGNTAAQRSQLNIFYIPLLAGKEADSATLLQTSSANPEKLGADYSKSLYDYKMARGLLDHLCNPPDPSVRKLCNGDLSRGPYIFTYASSASNMEPVPPPFLFVDLSDVHEQAFGELLAAFKAQVKRQDISDQAKIRTLRLTILDITLTAADWVSPVEKAISDIVHSAPDDDKK